MAKLFSSSEAKTLIEKHKRILEELMSVLDHQDHQASGIRDTVEKIITSRVIEPQVEQFLRNNSQSYQQAPGIEHLINQLFAYKSVSAAAEQARQILSINKNSIDQAISWLKPGGSGLRWLFTASENKEKANQAYAYLSNLLSGNYPIQVKKCKEDERKAEHFSTSEAYYDFEGDKQKYKNLLSRVVPDVTKDGAILPIYNNPLQKKQRMDKDIAVVTKSLDKNKDAIIKSAERMMAQEVYNILRGVPIEELNRKGSGIRVKALREFGYGSMANIYTATVSQLASVRGISEDTAYKVKRIANQYVEETQKKVKIRISADNRTKEATKLVSDLYIYKRNIEKAKRVNEFESVHRINLDAAETVLLKEWNGINWPFYNGDEKTTIKNAYQYLIDCLNKDYPAIEADCRAYQEDRNISAEDAWKDFLEDPIAYNTILEDLVPGMLGNDDYLYGLPEDLAREIQDEAFFPDGLLCDLRRYQEWGVKYILHQERVLLGDEMGLGKTVQAIAAMVSLRNTGETHFVVVCPASVVTNWCREITKHSKLRVTKVHGAGRTGALRSWIKAGGVAVTTYETTGHFKLEEHFHFGLLVVDEAHYIKNPEAKRTENVKKLCSYTQRMLFMTGTALENKVGEMIALIGILRPDLVSNIEKVAFMAAAQQFRSLIAPVYYRRKREDVLTELPELIETEEWCSLNAEEETIYEEAVLSKDRTNIRRVSWNVDDLQNSSKANRLMELIEEAKEENRKVIVFSFYLETIRQIGLLLGTRCYGPINGSVPVKRRQDILDEFEGAPAGSVLIAQIQSGGTGLNIQSASVVVICEPQFKPSTENQAISRAYRMGQARNVLVFRLLCENTVDEYILKILKEKQDVFDAFADKSVAAEKSNELDETTFGEIIQEEIDRINNKRKGHQEEEDHLFEEEEPVTTFEYEESDYQKLLTLSYSELVNYFMGKYGAAKYDYFRNVECTVKDPFVKRTKEGLYCHHIDEDKAIKLSVSQYASAYPFEYQKADRLVYCNLLEHLLLHVKIAEEVNNGEYFGIGGAIAFLCPELNDIYAGKQLKNDWRANIVKAVIDKFDDYILVLKYFWKVIDNNPQFRKIYSKESLCRGSDEIVVPRVMNALISDNIIIQ